MKNSIPAMRKMIRDERGIALPMVLVLSAITLGIMSGLVYMITTGTVTSGVQKRYKTAYEANYGGMDVTQEVIGFRGDEPDINNLCDDHLQNCSYTTPDTCVPSAAAECTSLSGYDATYTKLQTKLNLPTDCWNNCDDSITIDPDTPSTYDMRFEVGTAPDPVYTVYAKIVDATEGNSGTPTDVVEPCGVAPGCNEAQVPQIVYLYTLEVLAQSAANPLERAKTSTLFAY